MSLRRWLRKRKQEYFKQRALKYDEPLQEASQDEHHLISELKASFQKLSGENTGRTSAEREWIDNTLRLRELVLNADVREFLRWDVVASHTDDFEQTFTCAGLLEIDELLPAYERFFARLQSAYPQVPVCFLHFPAVLETRRKFIERVAAIREALETVSRRHSNVIGMTVPDEIVRWPSRCEDPELKKFPYHYDEEVYRHFVSQIQALPVVYPWHCKLIDKLTKRKLTHELMTR